METKAKIEVSNKNDIKVDTDKEGKKYTNESIFEFLVNRKAQIVPDGIETTATFSGGGSGELPAGAYATPVGDFDIAKACVWITNNSHPHYIKGVCGYCARAVRSAMEAGGLSTNGRPNSAYQYAGFLPTIGFKLVATLPTLDAQKNYTQSMAKPGDIAVMAHGEHGHICLYNGNQWVSDFKQKGMWVYAGVGTCQVFRFAKA